MASLPEEIIEENILTRLPVKSISRFRCVSKNWNLLFRNPNFMKNHLNHAVLINNFSILVTKSNYREGSLYYIHSNVLPSFLGQVLKIDYPLMSRFIMPKILGSSNGLVCIRPVPGTICIWNPATREYKQLPAPSPSSNDLFIAHGFGFDCKNDDYKVLIIVGFFRERRFNFEARLYSLASDSWKNLGTVPYGFKECLDDGLLHNGHLHWIVNSVVVCFDISNETFHHVPLPNRDSHEGEEPSFTSYLGIWEGKLCLLCTNHMEDPDICGHQNDRIDVWIMMDGKWSKLFEIATHMPDMYYARPIQTLQNGEILFKRGPMAGEGCCLLSYDPNLERARALKIQGYPEYSEVETYIETLVALNSSTYVGAQLRQRKSMQNKKEKKWIIMTDADMEL